MTDISVVTTNYQVENRGWLWGEHGTEPGSTPSITLDVSKFTAGTHYPNGTIPSGTVLGKVSATGLYGPYDDTASDGRQTAAGLLFGSLPALNANGTAKAKVGGALFVHGFVDPARMPFSSGSGAIDANGKADLPLIHWA